MKDLLIGRLHCVDSVKFRKFKLPSQQHGHAYLTSYRVCYVDNAEPRKNSIAIELKHVERCEFYVILRLLGV